MDPAIMTIQEMIEGCRRDEGAAWAELWCLVDDAVRPLLRRLLQSCHAHRTLVDDALQEFYLHLQEQNLRRLQAFRGNTEAEFRAFLRTMATRFFWRLVGNWHEARQREADALRQTISAGSAGPTEAQVQARLQELESCLSEEDRVKWWAVPRQQGLSAGTEPGQEPIPPPPSSRTVRRWE